MKLVNGKPTDENNLYYMQGYTDGIGGFDPNLEIVGTEINAKQIRKNLKTITKSFNMIKLDNIYNDLVDFADTNYIWLSEEDQKILDSIIDKLGGICGGKR